MTAPRPRRTGATLLADGLGALVFGGLVLWLGPLSATEASPPDPVWRAAFATSTLLLAAAIAVRRVRPGLSLALAWVSTLVHMAAVLDVAAAQLGLLVVLYSTARHGSPRVLRLAGISAGVGALIAIGYLLAIGSWATLVFPFAFGGSPVTQLLAFVALVGAALAVPWLLGLLVRTLGAAREARERRAEAEVEARRAQQIAELERARTELARDVHDIVGHSLAVIIAQAESLRFLRDGGDAADGRHDPASAAAEAVTATIAETARRSLADVRRVLERTTPVAAAALPDLDELVGEVAAARPGVASSVTGDARPLGEEASVAAYRVAQELLTNALKHGDPAGAITIVRRFSAAELEIVVTNAVADGAAGAAGAAAADGAAAAPEGRGLGGVRDRLAAIGGRLRTERTGEGFVARASIPLQPVESGAPA